MDRIARLARELQESGIDAYMAQTPISMGYLHGFYESGHERFMSLAVSAAGETRLICPALSATQAKRAGIRDMRPWRDGEDPLALFAQLAEDWNLRSGIVAVDDEMPAQMVLKMQGVLPAALFKPGQEVISKLMRSKDAGELELMRRAARIADDAFLDVLGYLRPGLTEDEVSQFLSDAMRKRGGTPSFAIVATGPGGAEPHHINGESRLEEGHVLILDFGCGVGGYQSDITRTVAIGSASEEAKHVYRTVHAAHQAGRSAVRPGVAAQDVDAAARRVIEDAGMGELFFHRLGHGIGMRGHEEPYIIAGNTEALRVGECFSVEPGVYRAGEFGVRIENIVTVTEDGHESLNDDPEPELRVV
ncbi:MAG TPA: Xaa-Pro peptidase family protein [Fimbriimonas sp.]